MSVCKKPEIHKEMSEYMDRIGVSEGFDFRGHIVNNGWASDEEEARLYLESLDIFPWED